MTAAPAISDVATLYTAYSDWLRGWLLQRTRCPQRAADLAQDTFCRLLTGAEARSIRDGRSFLATIARRLIIDDARRARVEAAFLQAHATVMEGMAEPGPDRIAEAVSELRAIVEALDMLAGKARRAYLLARLDGWSHAAIAAELGVSKSMVKQYIAKAYAHCYVAAYGAAGDRS
ncbi:sigma-70 family RNA polymerase sigma factor [Novosphingobium rosa]|uniref:sigma-70 family RNA polymerase sigma factor n=1 Tax=Novosphingobium rosa TaxID=76978 RepID=UPI0008303949|nr:sigma-70 family RNA polymerase sigma factor [Novosphingobium rosa]